MAIFHLPKRVRRLLPDKKSITDPASEQDRRIARRLQDLFEYELALSDIGGLQFFVHKGSVVLRGAFTSDSDREAIVQMVAELPEVRRVVDHLERQAVAA